jgi:hypothetical protein
VLIAYLLATHVAACENDGRLDLSFCIPRCISSFWPVGVGSFAPHHMVAFSALQVLSLRFLPGLKVMALFSMPPNIQKGVD